jgi:hydrolase, P-loop family
MKALGRAIGQALTGSEVIELVGDVGAGKTTLTKGLAEGLVITEPIQSPTFTISRVYDARDGLRLCHYDFYRLGEAGIMGDEISEMMQEDLTITVIEWAGAVNEVLPSDRLVITIAAITETERQLEVTANGARSERLLGAVNAFFERR